MNSRLAVVLKRFIAVLGLGLMGFGAFAGQPLWTMVPAPGNDPTRSFAQGETAALQYVVQNQSNKPRSLVMQPLAGITQTSPSV